MPVTRLFPGEVDEWQIKRGTETGRACMLQLSWSHGNAAPTSTDFHVSAIYALVSLTSRTNFTTRDTPYVHLTTTCTWCIDLHVWCAVTSSSLIFSALCWSMWSDLRLHAKSDCLPTAVRTSVTGNLSCRRLSPSVLLITGVTVNSIVPNHNSAATLHRWTHLHTRPDFQ